MGLEKFDAGFLERRSDFKPTRIRGVVGQKWRTSGYHWTICQHGSFSLAGLLVMRSDLVHDIFQRIGTVNCETDEEKVRFWVRERS